MPFVSDIRMNNNSEESYNSLENRNVHFLRR